MGISRPCYLQDSMHLEASAPSLSLHIVERSRDCRSASASVGWALRDWVHSCLYLLRWKRRFCVLNGHQIRIQDHKKKKPPCPKNCIYVNRGHRPVSLTVNDLEKVKACHLSFSWPKIVQQSFVWLNIHLQCAIIRDFPQIRPVRSNLAGQNGEEQSIS